MLIGSDGPAVVLDARTAAWLEKYAGLSALRIRVRGTDPHISRQLEEIRVASLRWRSSATGTEEAAEPELASGWEWLSTGEAAKELDMTDRGIRKAIDDGRLPAVRVAGRHRIAADDLEHFKCARAGRE